MTLTLFVLFLLSALIFGGLIYLIWRMWWNYSQMTPTDKEFDARIAALNDNQANRVSDERLAKPINPEDAWQVMVRRGQRQVRSRNQPRRTGPRRP